MDDRGMSPAASGQPAPGPARRAASAYEPPHRASDWADDPARGVGFTTARLVRRRDHDQPTEETGTAPTVMAEWALWGKEGGKSAYHVLRCSKGTFGLDDFHEIITRYASGVKETLPQYTVCWIPAGELDQGFLAVGIHELADRDPSRSGGRARTAGGREIEYVRLFCVRYADLAERGVSYTDLVEAVRSHQLPADLTGPIKVVLPEATPRSLTAPFPQLAENVATLLLTTSPVCVLGAEAATAKDRLVFIDMVMSLLPYGLRTTLSASTWASSTAQDLKLRLFFTNAKRDDGGRTYYVAWGQPKELIFRTEDGTPALYQSWLGSIALDAAPALLVDETDPVRFNPAEIRQMVATLPEDRSVADTLKQLASYLRLGDQNEVRAMVRRLRRSLAGKPTPPDERQKCRRLIGELDLLEDHPGIHPRTSESIYRVLLKLAFETPLSYASFGQIEEWVGGPPRGPLRSEMLKLRFTSVLPWLLTAKAERGEFTNEDLMAGLAEEGVPATVPLQELQHEIESQSLRRAHRVLAYDFALRYLRTYAADPRAELKRLGYLANTLEALFPRDRQAQLTRLEATLRLVYGGSLSRSEVSELFADLGTPPTAALEAAVRHLSSFRAGSIIAEEAAYARIRQAGHGDDIRIIQDRTRGRFRRRFRRRALGAPNTIWAFPRRTVYGAVFIFVMLAVVILVLVYGATRA